MNTIIRTFLFLMTSCLITGLSTPVYAGEKEADLIILGTPYLVDQMEINTVVDAIEDGVVEISDLSSFVSFRIDRVVRGELSKMKTGGLSKMDQLKEHAENKSFLKLITLDMHDPDEEVEKKWFRIAVRNPQETFGFAAWGDPERKPFKLYLSQVPDMKDNYIFLRAEAAE